MRRAILVGEKSATAMYVTKYIEDNAIRPFSITRFEEKLKIADVRRLKQLLSVHHGEGIRLILIENEILPAAQQALLKTIEELPDDTDLLICVEQKENLLPTILSRCQIISLLSQEQGKNGIDEVTLEKYFTSPAKKEKMTAVFQIAEVLSKVDDVPLFISQVRRLMLTAQNTGDTVLTKRTAQFLERFLEPVSLIDTNNLNLRFTLESLLLSS
jgi:hypothetical protein